MISPIKGELDNTWLEVDTVITNNNGDFVGPTQYMNKKVLGLSDDRRKFLM
jgi:hypothetical protein